MKLLPIAAVAMVTAAALPAGCATHQSSPQVPDGVRLVSRAEWGARPPVLPMRRHAPVRITIHHTGTNQAPARSIEDKLRGLQLFSQRDDSLASGRKKPPWADVPYHYYIGVDGGVGEGRDWRYVGDSNTPYDPTGHLLIVVEGNFQRDTLAPAQRRTLEVLLPAMARHFRIPADKLASHRDFAETSCPGEHLYAQLPRLRELIAAEKPKRAVQYFKRRA